MAAKRGMGPRRIIVMPPPGKLADGVAKAAEDFLFQKLVAQSPVEHLDEGILCRLAWCNVVPVDAGLVLPFENSSRRQLGPVVTDDPARFAK